MTEIRVGAAPTIRTANKAIIIRDGKLLCTVNSSPREGFAEFLMLPGGGQEWGENRIEGMIREAQEELRCDVVPRSVACMRSYIGAHHQFAEHDSWFHQEEVFWFCDLAEGAEPRWEKEFGDDWQTGIRWVPVAELPELPFFPHALAVWLTAPEDQRPIYLGDVN